MVCVCTFSPPPLPISCTSPYVCCDLPDRYSERQRAPPDRGEGGPVREAKSHLPRQVRQKSQTRRWWPQILYIIHKSTLYSITWADPGFFRGKVCNPLPLKCPERFIFKASPPPAQPLGSAPVHFTFE